NLIKQLEDIKNFNSENIYTNHRLNPFKEYSKFIINQIFKFFLDHYEEQSTISNLVRMTEYYPKIIPSFLKWLSIYCNKDFVSENFKEYKVDLDYYDNTKIYGNLETKEIYAQAILDYISGMTDRFAIETFNKLLTYEKFTWFVLDEL
ncbi:MAG TPA: hypothetical protein PLZ84_05070, partial [Clostridia bacterium]|nr:hypothetical protein [Clostridia bacterium]